MLSTSESRRRANSVKWERSLAGCFLALTFCGCAGYRLGPTNGLAAREKSIQVSPFVNQTLQPRLSDAVTSQIRKELQRDGTYELASHDDGDIVVSGVLTLYHRHELSFVPQDLVTVRDYRLSLTAQVTVRERDTGKIILDRPVTGYTIIRVGSDLTGTERQAAPLLAADLAKQVTALLVDGSW
jgi:Lipopolysaccharide-assembly